MKLMISQKANFLASVGEKTPAFVRFSTVTVGREYPDEARNPRGFAIKLYTMEGNYDIVGLNFPVFFYHGPQDTDMPRWITANRNLTMPKRSLTASWSLTVSRPGADHAKLWLPF